MSVKIETPPRLTGEAERQLQQVYSYLFRLSEYLNVALNNLNEDSYAKSAQQQTPIQETVLPAGVKREELTQSYNELKALVISTAEITRLEMDKIETELNGQYTAISSQWGTYKEEMASVITATAKDVVQELNYDARLDALDQQAAGFSAYQIHTEGYIRSGFIDYDENGVPIIGVAVGQGLTSTTVTIDGVAYEQLDPTQNCAFYTATKVSFRINGVEVAYVSNRKLYIHDVEITGSVVLGGTWQLTTNGGLLIKWIGGE